ncbi:DNA-dependent metalloprotease WSS1 like protein [Verticillium longisporum]|uniref:DNA-dependent metalloprotease WSS1 like protein n=1 Tax=Verticillium longisporum TaxID=100787 RepID=A0A8I2Z9F2_VERLO|nr:DNA-dependent metalloprotease WSS1 like protein [Verticillium longisporum]
MPIGIQRINAKKSHPNERIIFIKPLPGPNEKIARDFLERIAAQCLPIMKDNSLSVMSLEEYEPNREFVGRNFNAGEVIQLVLKTRAGRWLPFEYVQMVMMHELAHCKQMNHSRAFWAVRNAYADSMRTLWSRGYTGDGLWGRGTLLASGAWAGGTAPLGEGLPEHLCGGTFRSRGRRKRKAKPPRLSYREQKERRILKKFGANGVALGADEEPRLSYREQKERRILKKFGANGVALGADEAVKSRLEKGRKTAAKPRQKVEQQEEEDDDDECLAKSENVSEDESDYEDGVADIKREDAIDLNGQRLLDKDGRGMIKVCEDENPDDQDAQQELQELRWRGWSHRLGNRVAMTRLNVHSPQMSQR